jgi:hypothetical protein
LVRLSKIKQLIDTVEISQIKIEQNDDYIWGTPILNEEFVIYSIDQQQKIYEKIDNTDFSEDLISI